MRAKINEDGYLFIRRSGELKRAFCPYKDGFVCGDWCPLFCEPVIGESPYKIKLELCQKVYYIEQGNFKDERPMREKT